MQGRKKAQDRHRREDKARHESHLADRESAAGDGARRLAGQMSLSLQQVMVREEQMRIWAARPRE